jgi:divalent metal cation (Fe/Co/Zn/Cd) transporter
LLDGVEPEVPDEVRNVALVTDGVRGVAEVRVRWLGHKILAEMNIAEDMHHQLLHNLKYLSNATVHVDPVGLAGEEYHRHGIGNTEHQESHVDEHEEHGHSHD